jgi:hypothetical protein
MPFLPLLLGLAPTVASWIMGDRTGAAVSKVTGIAQEILGTSDAAGIERAISTDPNLALQFRMAVIQAEADARRQAFDTPAGRARRRPRARAARRSSSPGRARPSLGVPSWSACS